MEKFKNQNEKRFLGNKLSRQQLKNLKGGLYDLQPVDDLEAEAACPRKSACASGRGRRHGNGTITCC